MALVVRHDRLPFQRPAVHPIQCIFVGAWDDSSGPRLFLWTIASRSRVDRPSREIDSTITVSPSRTKSSILRSSGRSALAPESFSKNVRSAPRSARASVCRSRFCSYVETRPYPIVDIGFLRIQTLCCFTETYLPAAGDYRYQGIAPLKNVGLWTLDKT